MTYLRHAAPFVLCLLTLVACSKQPEIPSPGPAFPNHGSIERYAPEFDKLVSPDAKMEILAQGYRWSEGPVWDVANNRLLFTDVPENTAYAWTEEDGVSIFLRPSGHAELNPEGIRSPGANGLAFTPGGQLALCQHGNQQIALYDEANKSFTTLVDRYGDRTFYSPNDLVYAASGDLYFTDPPYGLLHEQQQAIKTHYVYRRSPDGTVSQVTDSIAYPNGIGLSPQGDTLYVASSDNKAAAIHALALDESGDPTGSSTLLFDANDYRSESRKGGCDGMAIDEHGNIWTTGPGGVYVIQPDGKVIGFLNTDGRLANCAFGGPDGATLYITAAEKLLRIETLVKGLRL